MKPLPRPECLLVIPAQSPVDLKGDTGRSPGKDKRGHGAQAGADLPRQLAPRGSRSETSVSLAPRLMRKFWPHRFFSARPRRSSSARISAGESWFKGRSLRARRRKGSRNARHVAKAAQPMITHGRSVAAIGTPGSRPKAAADSAITRYRMEKPWHAEVVQKWPGNGKHDKPGKGPPKHDGREGNEDQPCKEPRRVVDAKPHGHQGKRGYLRAHRHCKGQKNESRHMTLKRPLDQRADHEDPAKSKVGQLERQ